MNGTKAGYTMMVHDMWLVSISCQLLCWGIPVYDYILKTHDVNEHFVCAENHAETAAPSKNEKFEE